MFFFCNKYLYICTHDREEEKNKKKKIKYEEIRMYKSAFEHYDNVSITSKIYKKKKRTSFLRVKL